MLHSIVYSQWLEVVFQYEYENEPYFQLLTQLSQALNCLIYSFVENKCCCQLDVYKKSNLFLKI